MTLECKGLTLFKTHPKWISITICSIVKFLNQRTSSALKVKLFRDLNIDLQELAAQSLQATLQVAQQPVDAVEHASLAYPRYESTPWSQRAPSISLTLSVIPSIKQPTPTPAPALSTTSNTRFSESRTPRLTTKSDKTIVLRIAYHFRDIYGRIPMSHFWKRVAAEVSQSTGQPTNKSTYSRMVTKWIKERKRYLEELESREQDQLTLYTDALDL